MRGGREVNKLSQGSLNSMSAPCASMCIMSTCVISFFDRLWVLATGSSIAAWLEFAPWLGQRNGKSNAMAPRLPSSAMRREQKEERKAIHAERLRRARAEEQENRKGVEADRKRKAWAEGQEDCKARVDSHSGHSLGDEAMRVSPTCPKAFVSLLYGDTDEFFVYALVLAGQLRRNSRAADRVLLLGPGKAAESRSCCHALVRAGWTHLVAVEAVDTPHLDKTS